ncbi:MAG: Na+/H+ antiporter subunit D [Microbacteriaceae bacterium]
MTLPDILIPLVAIVPFLAAALTLTLARFQRAQMIISISALAGVAAISAVLLAITDAEGGHAVQVGNWEAPFGIVLVVDRLSALMLLISALMLLGVLLFAIGQGIADGGGDTPVTIFNPAYLMMSAGLFVAFIAGDLFNMYVGFEILLAASYVLLTLGGTGARTRAGVIYIVISLVSSVFFLAAIAVIYGATGTVNMAQLAVRIAELGPDTQLMLHVLLLIGFGIKAAVFPLSFWLPDSYPTAPAPVTAVFAGLLTKVGIYAIIRTETLLFPGGDLTIVLMVVAALTMIIGILGAVAQADIKRLLSFTLVSHIGYMIFGISTGLISGMTATVYYIIHHIAVQTALFLVAGLIERVGGSSSLYRLGGMIKLAPFVALLYFIPALNLGGIPPFSGFVGKFALFRAGAEQGDWLSWTVIGAGALTSLLTLYALFRVWNMAFWRTREEVQGYESQMLVSLQEAPADLEAGKVNATISKLMTGATTGMILVTLSLTVFAGPIFDLAERTASDLFDNSIYIETVFPNGGDK